VNRKLLTLEEAKSLARIGATEGKHDRSVTTNPRSRGFEMVAQYEAGTGRNVTQALRENRLPPGKIQRRTTTVRAETREEFAPRAPVHTTAPVHQGWRYDPQTGAPLEQHHTSDENVDEDGSPLEDYDD
jgi:hypothetical protein